MTPATARKALDARRVQLHQRLGLSPIVETTGPGDQADEAAERSARVLAFATREQLLVHLQEVEAALERIEAGRYGLCTACQEAIAPARLRVFPEAALCIRDAEAAERARAAQIVRVRIAEEPEDDEPEGRRRTRPPEDVPVSELEEDRC